MNRSGLKQVGVLEERFCPVQQPRHNQDQRGRLDLDIADPVGLFAWRARIGTGG